MDMILFIDASEVSLSDFIKANTGEDVEAIEPTELDNIKNLKVGESCFIASHAGFTEVKRIS